MIQVVKQFEPVETSMADIFNTTVFLAGGITNSWDWQTEVINILDEIDKKEKQQGVLRIYNPREEYNVDNKVYTMEDRIKWDYEKMNNATIFSAYLTKEATQGATLFEIGRYVTRMQMIYHSREAWKHLCISIEDGYKHKEKLISYLKMIIGEENYDLVVEEDSSPKLHAARLYTLYVLHNRR